MAQSWKGADTRPIELSVLTWNLFHGRDFPPDPALRTLRSRLTRRTEQNSTHAQVNRDLFSQFASVIAGWEWDLALFQECPPHWCGPLARACRAEPHLVLTSRNSLTPLRRLVARANPDLIASNEGGSNLTLVRGAIAERRELVLTPGPRPERRVMAFTRTEASVCVANLHASAGPSRRAHAERELRQGAAKAVEWAAGAPLIFGGDLNVRPSESDVFAHFECEHGLTGATSEDSLDHLLTRGLEPAEAPHQLPYSEREVTQPGGVVLRLSDHAPVIATMRTPAIAEGG